MEEKQPFIAMNETIKMLKNRVMDCLESSDLDAIMQKFGEISEPTIIIGSGGSSVASKFIASVIEEKNGIICEAKLPEEVMRMNLKPYKNIIAVSRSGNSSGASKSFEYAKEFGVDCKLLTMSNQFDKEQNIIYQTSLEQENSFISFANTIMPMALALCYYIGDKNKAKRAISEFFDIARSNPTAVKLGDVYEIIGKESCPTACAFVESCLNESSIATPVVSGKYDMLHGRTTSILEQDNRQIIHIVAEQYTELDQFLDSRLADNGITEERMTGIFADFGDFILDDFYLTLNMAYWCKDLAEAKGVDLTTMTNANGDRIHMPMDMRAIKLWEKENGKSFWEDKPDWSELNDIGKGKHSAGFYAPTGKFAYCDMGVNGRKTANLFYLDDNTPLESKNDEKSMEKN